MGKAADVDVEVISAIQHDEHHVKRIRNHYIHARRKHPYFCDCLSPTGLEELPPGISKSISFHLSAVRAAVAGEAKNGTLGWDGLLNCEVWEVYEALANNNAAQAIEELYDCVAICLRTIDVLEGRQKLGKPETISGNSAGSKKENNK